MEPFNDFYDTCAACAGDDGAECMACQDRPFVIGPDAHALIARAAAQLSEGLRVEALSHERTGRLPLEGVTATVLPSCYSMSYTPALMRQMADAVEAVAQNFTTASAPRMRCTAEELAGHALLRQARHLLGLPHAGLPEPARADCDLTWLGEMAFDDWDVLLLFEPSLDGFQDQPEFASMGASNLAVDEWFTPFSDSRELAV